MSKLRVFPADLTKVPIGRQRQARMLNQAKRVVFETNPRMSQNQRRIKSLSLVRQAMKWVPMLAIAGGAALTQWYRKRSLAEFPVPQIIYKPKFGRKRVVSKSRTKRVGIRSAKLKSKVYTYMPRRRKYRRKSGVKARLSRLEKGQAGKELKTHDLSLSLAPSSTASVTLLNGIAQGDTSKTREGLYIKIQSLRVQMLQNNNAAVSPYYIRTIIVKDTMNQGALPTITELLENTTVYDFKEHDEKHRFQFLYDKTKVFNASIDAVAVGKWVDYYKRFSNPIKAWYTGTTGVIGSVNKNALFLVILAASGSVGGLNGACRIRFTD